MAILGPSWAYLRPLLQPTCLRTPSLIPSTSEIQAPKLHFASSAGIISVIAFVENVDIFEFFFHMIGVVAIVLWCVRRCVRVGNRVWILIGGVACLWCEALSVGEAFGEFRGGATDLGVGPF